MSEKTLNIKNPDTVRLARRLAAHDGTSITEAITSALRERLERLEKPVRAAATRAAVARIQALVAGLPQRDGRSGEEILGYDDHGLPS